MRVYWLCWLVLGFGVPETVAFLRGRDQDTLSEVTWRAFDVVPGKTVWQVGILQLLLIFILTWVYMHLAFGWWRVWRA